MAKKLPQINASSTADMAFLLLTFFLMTTTMNVDSGIQRVLPPIPPDDQQAAEVNQRNVFLVKVSQWNELLVNNERMDITQLKDKVVEFLVNPYNELNLSNKKEVEIEGIGKVMVSEGVVSLQNDRGTNYGTYIQVQNELARAINELREQASQRYFNQSYNNLEEAQKRAINNVIPQAISEALPRSNV